jgi:hypothetical protein
MFALGDLHELQQIPPVLRQQRKSDVITHFGHSSRSAASYKAGSPFCRIEQI